MGLKTTYVNRCRFIFLHLFCGLIIPFLTFSQSGNSQVKIDALVASMTLEEKVGQMTQINLEVILKKENGVIVNPIEIDTAKLREAILEYKVGSFLNNGRRAHSRNEWLEVITAIQTMALSSPSRIPIIYGIDAIHGANYSSGSTLFPHQLGQAASWNPPLVKQIAQATAFETRSCAIPWVFSPIIDVGRQPLWSQFFETYGEDVLLTSIMGNAAVRGYQGEDLSDDSSVAACVKHYVGYSAPLSGKDRTPVYMDERHLRETYLPPFERAIEQGVRSMIVNSGELNGIPSHANEYLLKTVLRDELNFEGVVLSDWGDIERLFTVHRVSANRKEAAEIAIKSGVDICMVPNDFVFCENLIALVNEGKISESSIDESVRRILRLKFDLGLFDNPITIPENADERFGGKAHLELAYQAAAESITLLKNEGNILPLSADKEILVIGPAANSLQYLNGPWSRTWQGTDSIISGESFETISSAIGSKSNNTNYILGCSEDSLINLPAVLEAAAKSDIIILCLGEEPSAEKPGDIHDLTISSSQQTLAKALINAGKPIVLVLVEGRPRIVSSFVDDCDGVIMAYQPGSSGGQAVADVLFGKINPSGHLPFTYPRYVNDLLTYDHKKSEEVDNYYGGNGYDPQWSFGEGLSYTSFEYSDFKVNTDTLRQGRKIVIEIKVRNSGSRHGKDVVQLYASDEVASITPPVKRLRSFEKIDLKANESKVVSFEIGEKELAFVNAQMNWVTEEGWFTLEIEGLKKRVYYRP